MTSTDEVNTIAVIGAGTMGREIAQAALMAGFEHVMLNDIDQNIIKSALDYIETGLKKVESKGFLKQRLNQEFLMERLHVKTNLQDAVKNVDFVIEAIPEIMTLKQDLFARVSTLTLPDTILATNTSTMSITRIASAAKNPQNVVGMHFFTPVVVLRLIELIKGEQTSQKTFDISLNVANRFPSLKGKKFVAPIEKESPGFIVNRLTIAGSLYLNWILDYAIARGISVQDLDADIEVSGQLGPYAKWDYLGLDVVQNSLKYLAQELSSEFTPGKTISGLVVNGHLGRKTGQGLYEWKEGKPVIKQKNKAGLLDMEYYYAIQLNEGCKLLEEGIVSGYKIIDDAMLAGMDMPGPFGPGKKNYKKWSNMLTQLSEQYNSEVVKPCDIMSSGAFIEMKE